MKRDKITGFYCGTFCKRITMEVKKKKIKHYGQRSAQMDDAS